jgi:hypothetical protein
MVIYRFPDPFWGCCPRVGSQFALPEPSPAATIPLGLAPSLPVACEFFVPKIEAQLAAIKRMPQLVRSFFQAPTVAYITDC